MSNAEREVGRSESSNLPAVIEPTDTQLLVELRAPDGTTYSRRVPLRLRAGEGMVRLTMSEPDLWWPAGMGRQPLYDLTVTLYRGEEQACDSWRSTLGLTSVRGHGVEPAATTDVPESSESDDAPARPSPQAWWPGRSLSHDLLINGWPMSIHEIMPIDPQDESEILAVGADSILMVRGHFGPDVLYEAADRAGILVVQTVPALPMDLEPHVLLRKQIDRLSRHPSLAGWIVGELGSRAADFAAQIARLDPTRNVWNHVATQ